MRNKILLLVAVSVLLTFSAKAQLGIRAGVNMAKEIASFSEQDIKDGFSTGNLTGYQIGLVYQTYTKGLGFEIGALLSQKGSMYNYNDSSSVTSNISQAYKEINYISFPIDLRYRITLGPIGVFGLAGIYGDYALNGKTVYEAINYEEQQSYSNFMDHLDYGYTLGFGVEAIKKVQLAFNWSRGLVKKDESKKFYEITNYQPKSESNVFSVNLTYLF